MAKMCLLLGPRLTNKNTRGLIRVNQGSKIKKGAEMDCWSYFEVSSLNTHMSIEHYVRLGLGRG